MAERNGTVIFFFSGNFFSVKNQKKSEGQTNFQANQHETRLDFLNLA